MNFYQQDKLNFFKYIDTNKQTSYGFAKCTEPNVLFSSISGAF